MPEALRESDGMIVQGRRPDAADPAPRALPRRIDERPVDAAVGVPAPGARLTAGRVAVEGRAAAGHTRPALPAGVWNFKGHLSVARHRVRVAAE